MSADGEPDIEHAARPEPAGNGRVVVLSGPSAVGKSTVVRCLREQIPDLHFSVSVTTRKPRPNSPAFSATINAAISPLFLLSAWSR